MKNRPGESDLNAFIRTYVMTDPEWRALHEEGKDERAGARAIMRARLDAGLSQAELAKLAGTGQAVISRIERGAMSPTLDMFTRIGRALGLRPVIGFESRPRARTSAAKAARKTARPKATTRKTARSP